MAEKTNKKCIICGKEYRYCNSCNEKYPSWMALFDCDRCSNAYDYVVRWRDKIDTTAIAKKNLESLDLSDLDDFNDVTKSQIEQILSYQDVDNKEKNVDVLNNKNESSEKTTTNNTNTNKNLKTTKYNTSKKK